MNFALLGYDAAILPLLRAIVASETHRLSHVVGETNRVADVLNLAPSVRVVPRWEEVLLDQSVDAVILADVREELLEGARQLASAGKAIVVLPRAAVGSTWVYELALIRDDKQVTLFPLFPVRVHPHVEDVRRKIANGELGKVHHLQFTRELPVFVQSSAALPTIERSVAEEAALYDVDLIRWLGGEYNQVTSLETAADGNRFAQATITLAGAAIPEAAWTIRRSTGEPSWQLKVLAERDELVLSGGDDPAEVRLQSRADAEPQALRLDPGPALLGAIEAAARGESVRPSWTDLTRAFETLDGARRSIKKRRTIDLYFEMTSERSQFKTQMTAVGCSVMVLTLFAIVLLMLGGSLLDPREKLEVDAEAAGAVIESASFAENSGELNEAGRRQVAGIAERMQTFEAARFPVLVEQQPADGRSVFDAARRQSVVEALSAAGVRDAEQRTVVAPVRGKSYKSVMRVLWIVVYVPLFVFLLLQGLLWIAKPSAESAARGKQERPHLDGDRPS